MLTNMRIYSKLIYAYNIIHNINMGLFADSLGSLHGLLIWLNDWRAWDRNPKSCPKLMEASKTLRPGSKVDAIPFSLSGEEGKLKH